MASIRAVGIDWATKGKKRAAVTLELSSGQITVVDITCPLPPQKVAQLCTSAVDVVAVDTPFGWPTGFTAFVTSWSPSISTIQVPSSTQFRFRTTDMTVLNEVGKMPLSVSSDRIALGARTWAETVQNLNLGGRIDVTGTNPPSGLPPVIEVYPAATLAAIYPKSGAVPTADYKSNRTIRKRVLRAMMSDFSINCSRRYVRAILSRGKISEQIDALLAAFTGLVYLNRISGWQVRIPKNVELPAAQAEGWIFFPIRLSSTVAEQT